MIWIQPRLRRGRIRRRLGAAAVLVAACLPPGEASAGNDPIVGVRHLERPALVRAVLERNPSVEAARHAVAAARARERQVVALDDPLLSYGVAPRSVAGDAPLGYEARLSQRFPFPGTRSLRGAVARAEGEVAESDAERLRLELAFMASTAFDDYALADRSLVLTAQHRRLLETLEAAARAQLAAGQATYADVLQAEAEVAHVAHDAIVLEADRDIAAAQINGLLHRDPTASLPPPASDDAPANDAVLDVLQALFEEALRNHPDVRAARARGLMGASAARLARRARYPDFELMLSYNSMWDMPEHRWMVGIGVTVPLQVARRRGAVAEADAAAAQAGYEVARAEDVVRVEVFRAWKRVEEARHVFLLYAERLLPLAREQAAAVRGGLAAGRAGFGAVLEAERNLRKTELQEAAARADLRRRTAELAKALGRTPGISAGGAR